MREEKLKTWVKKNGRTMQRERSWDLLLFLF